MGKETHCSLPSAGLPCHPCHCHFDCIVQGAHFYGQTEAVAKTAETTANEDRGTRKQQKDAKRGNDFEEVQNKALYFSISIPIKGDQVITGISLQRMSKATKLNS